MKSHTYTESNGLEIITINAEDPELVAIEKVTV